MKQNVNMLLIGLIVLSIIAMIGFSLYYKKTYDDLSVRYQSAQGEVFAAAQQLNHTITEVNAKEEMLNEKERVLNTYMSELNLSKERETSLGEHFTDLKNTNLNLETNLSNTITERNQWKTSYDNTKRDLGVCQEDYTLEKTTSNERLTKIQCVQGLELDLNTNAERAVAHFSDANTQADSITSNANEIKSLAAGINNDTIRSQITSKANNLKDEASSLGSALDELYKNLGSWQYDNTQLKQCIG
jgi:chromosome segregation ATPase